MAKNRSTDPVVTSVSSDFGEALKKRFVKYFRYDNCVYWKDYYNKKLKRLDVAREQLYAELIYRYVGDRALVVDVGSGLGFLVKELAKYPLVVEAVDLFDSMMMQAKKYTRGSEIRWRKADILDLPEVDGSVDCACVMSVLEHFPLLEVQEDILPEMNRKIKNGGYLFVHVPVRTMLSMFARFYRERVSKDLPVWAIDDDGDVTHKMWLTDNEYVKMIEAAGFRLVNIDFNLYRSNLKPTGLANLMRWAQRALACSNVKLDIEYKQLPLGIKILKKVKANLALTSYMLFQKIK